LTAPRVVSHWACFKSSVERAEFVANAVRLDFRVADEHKIDDPETPYPFSVMLERIDHVDFNSINDVTIQLFRLAQEFNGDYDGWETSVETDAGT
jgi:regulator of RNase E activity RraB